MNNVTLPEVTVTPRNINLAGAVDRGRREWNVSVFTQTKVGPIKKMSVLDELARMFEAKGWTRINDSSYKNSKITVGDITTENVGMLNGKPVIFDPEAAYNEDIIKVSNAKFKNK